MDRATVAYNKLGQMYKGTKKPELLENKNTEVIKKSENNDKDNPYLKNAVMTASKERLTLMLYDGALKFMLHTMSNIESNDLGNSHKNCVRAQDIFSELIITLNMDYELSKNLLSLYTFIKDSLVTVNVKKDTELLQELINLTKDLRDTWAEAMKLANKA